VEVLEYFPITTQNFKEKQFCCNSKQTNSLKTNFFFNNKAMPDNLSWKSPSCCVKKSAHLSTQMELQNNDSAKTLLEFLKILLLAHATSLNCFADKTYNMFIDLVHYIRIYEGDK
jgi:hypothetical protein